jgi:hypothetical protein
LQTVPNGFYAVGPQAVDQLIFPLMASLGYRVVVLIYEYSFDSCGAKLYSKDRFSAVDGGFRF